LIETASPAGVWQEISGREFASVYNGEGKNAARTPLEAVFPRAAHLALFAVTLGPAVTEKIGALFAARDFALAALLDAACSEGAERAADELEARYEEHLRAEGAGTSENRHLRYSPGYCGWHVSGQRALFAALQPGDVGLTLRESCLMEPLKSISGVIVAGPAAIHDFTDDFEFCTDCAERACRSRIRRILDA
jgi:hypothetical protein